MFHLQNLSKQDLIFSYFVIYIPFLALNSLLPFKTWYEGKLVFGTQSNISVRTFCKIVNVFQPITISLKSNIIDVDWVVDSPLEYALWNYCYSFLVFRDIAQANIFTQIIWPNQINVYYSEWKWKIYFSIVWFRNILFSEKV